MCDVKALTEDVANDDVIASSSDEGMGTSKSEEEKAPDTGMHPASPRSSSLLESVENVRKPVSHSPLQVLKDIL